MTAPLMLLIYLFLILIGALFLVSCRVDKWLTALFVVCCLGVWTQHNFRLNVNVEEQLPVGYIILNPEVSPTVNQIPLDPDHDDKKIQTKNRVVP